MNPNPIPLVPPTPGSPPPPGFFKRNWKWLVPVGCITPFLCCGVFGAITYLGVSAAIKSSGAYVQAVARVVANPEVKQALGEPITPGLGISGEIKDDLNGGSADFSVPLSGPKGKGTLRVAGTKGGGDWRFSKLQVDTESGQTIDLLGGEPSGGVGTPPQGGAEEPDPTDDLQPDEVDPSKMDEPLVDEKEPPAKE